LKTKKFNCAPRLGDDIKIPKRSDILRIMKDLEPEVENVVFPITDFLDCVGEFIAKRFRVDVVAAQSDDVDIGDVNVNAYYDPDLDERKKISIELVLVTNPNEKYITLDKLGWTALCNSIADSLAHELIHMYQSRVREFEDVSIRQAAAFGEVPDAQEYLGNPDEIDAYAYNIAEELLEHKDPLSKLNSIKNIKANDSINLWAYIHAFDQNTEHPVIKKLLKKIYKNLKRR